MRAVKAGTTDDGTRPRCERAVRADHRRRGVPDLQALDPETRRHSRTYYLATGPVRELTIAHLAFRIR